MKKAILALAAAATVAAGTLSAPTSADARCRGCAVGAGVVGGLAIGAILGSAIANGQPRYAEPEPVYEVPPPPRVYYAEPPEYVEGPVCHIERHRYWNGYRWRHRRVEVCD